MELGAIGQFVGAITVVATLIYLAVQIRQNTHSLDESGVTLLETYQQRAEQAISNMHRLRTCEI